MASKAKPSPSGCGHGEQSEAISWPGWRLLLSQRMLHRNDSRSRSRLLLVVVMAIKAKPYPGRGGDCFCRDERSIAMTAGSEAVSFWWWSWRAKQCHLLIGVEIASVATNAPLQ